jgi:hypothetical protein
MSIPITYEQQWYGHREQIVKYPKEHATLAFEHIDPSKAQIIPKRSSNKVKQCTNCNYQCHKEDLDEQTVSLP